MQIERYQPCIVLALLLSSVFLSTPVAAQPGAEEPEPVESTEKVEAEDADELPLFSELPLPELESLLEGAKQDWILLIGGRVLRVPGLWPRPDHLEWLEREQKDLLDDRPPADPELADWLEDYKRYFYIYLAVSEEGVEDDYRLHVRYVDRILYHEDLCLLKVDKLLLAGDIENARRLISAVGRWEKVVNDQREEERLKRIRWPGLIDRERALLRAEVQRELNTSQWERAFSLIKRRYVTDPDDPQLPILTGDVLNGIGNEAYPRRDYRRLRYFIAAAVKMFPAQRQAGEWKQRLTADAETLLATAEEDAKAGRRRESSLRAQQAARIWPFSAQINRRVQILQEQYQTLDFGVVENEPGGERALDGLQTHKWIGIERLSEGYPLYQSRFIETWQPDDLGRRITLHFMLNRQPSESRPIVDSHHFARSLLGSTLERRSEQRGLFANNLTEVHVASPSEIEIQFASQMPHPLARLAAILDGQPDEKPPVLLDSHFRYSVIDQPLPFEDFESCYQRAFEPPRRNQLRNVAEVHRHIYPDRQELLRALLRDEVHLLPETPLEYVDRIGQDQRFGVLEYQVPQSVGLRFRIGGRLDGFHEYRLALMLMLNREDLLAEVVPEGSPGQSLTKISNSICPSSSHAWSPSQLIPAFDETSARALMILLRRNPNLPLQIRLGCPSSADMRKLAAKIAERWKRLGVETEIVVDSTSGAEALGLTGLPEGTVDVDLVQFCMAAPDHELPRLATSRSHISVDHLASLPSYVRTTLLRLENARNWNAVNTMLRQLQDQMLINAWYMPLYESRRFMTVRREVRQVPSTLMETFQTLDRWIVEPIVPEY
ncbi:hypothetical protein [Rubinisphaera margarita]|uniref:hypothetical protein n=1 Tax=Rubinisphaera margarita TaxID=2909586 RepID=UPI001EE91F1F|nr:hypothetical protein [Rubinisphaera margarita]MCG6156284.1 hypothetical protein [Rubinisphaera margarita]